MAAHQHFPSEEALIRAAFDVRRDVLSLAGEARDFQLGPSMRAACTALSQSGLGADPRDLYQRLLTVVVAAEDVAVRLRVANPDMAMEER